MGKFRPETWKPSDDSSPGYRTDDPTCVVLLQKDNGFRLGCPCGCGDFPLSAKAEFCMGHDARLRGILIRAHLMGVKIRWTDGTEPFPPVDPYDCAKERFWASYLDEAVMRREGRNREVLRRTMGSDRLVKVGRWEYTGQVAAVYRLNGGDMVEIEYVNQAGDVKKVRVPADQTSSPGGGEE